MARDNRPKYLNLFTLALKMSITAKVSILHRISGVILFLSIPFFLFILNQSLISPDFYNTLYGICSGVCIKSIYLVILAAFIYHMLSGIRFLFLDIDKGVKIQTAKLTARIVLATSIIVTIILGIYIW